MQFCPGIVIWERRPRWEAEFKRRLGHEDIVIRVCRVAGDVERACAMLPGSVLLVDLAVGELDCLRLLAASSLWVPAPLPVVVSPRELAELEWAARELGALEFQIEPVSASRLVALCAAQFSSRRSRGETEAAPVMELPESGDEPE
jgi:hypothetical protein